MSRAFPVAIALSFGALLACDREVPAAVATERVLEIGASEYAFQVADTVTAGRTLVRLKNSGKVLHEMIVLKLRPGVTVKDLMDAQVAKRSARTLFEGGSSVLFAPAGKTGSGALVVDFEAGHDYALWCNFTDGEGKPEHSTLGMFKQLHVRATDAAAQGRDSLHVVMIDAADYAFRMPDTVAAGLTELRMRNVGAQQHEVSYGRLRNGITGQVFYREYLAKRTLDSLYDDDGAVLVAYAGDTNQVAIRAHLESGRRYVILCEFRDSDSAPVHGTLGMFKEIVVR